MVCVTITNTVCGFFQILFYFACETTIQIWNGPDSRISNETQQMSKSKAVTDTQKVVLKTAQPTTENVNADRNKSLPIASRY